MPYAQNGDARLYYETFGNKGREPVLMLAGAGKQLIDFDEDFCSALVDAGFRAIRMDSRDVGLSTGFTNRPSNLVDAHHAATGGRSAILAYDVEDMAKDALAVLDAEGKTAAHLFGRSLGSLVAQAVALQQPDRVLSLTLAIAFSRSLAETMTVEGLARIEGAAFADEDAFAQGALRTGKAVGSPAHFDAAEIERLARLAYRRGVHPGGSARHFAVGVGAPDLRPQIAALSIPTVVLHGALDRMIPLSFAQETAAAIPGARLVVFEDMAHDAPPIHRPRWIELFVENARR